MKIRSSALTVLALSTAIAAAGGILALTGTGTRFYSQPLQGVQLAQMLFGMLAVVVLLFVLGFVRYDVPSGLALGIAGLHDQLLTLALTSIVSLAFPQSYAMPALVVASAVFTCCFTIPILRESRLIGRGVSLREHTRDEVARMAVMKTLPVTARVLMAVLLILIAFVVSGGVLMFGFIVPLLAGIIASFLSATCITPYVWAAAASRTRSRR